MNEFREQWLNEREKEDLELFEKIKDNPKPDIEDLWSLSEEKFIEWRKLHDFPRLLKHFDETLLLFKEWKADNNLTDDIIISTGEISPFLENKKLSTKDKSLYLTKQKQDDNIRLYIAYEKTEGEKKRFGTIFKYELLQTFTPYLDWLKLRGKYQEILFINLRTAPGHHSERVWIHADVYANKKEFELLKMGGRSVPVNALGILRRGKRIEFTNLCGLTFEGDISFGEEGNLSCIYCACDNWQAEEFSMPMVTLEHCSVNNFIINNSTLQNWTFYDCIVSGDFSFVKLYTVNIYGGSFDPVLQDCTLSETHVLKDSNILDGNYSCYKTFKKIYQRQGDDDIANFYFIRENEYVRKNLKGWEYITKSLSYYYWEYGSKPHRIIYFSMATILLFGIIFWLNSDLISANAGDQDFGFADGLYFSIVTYTTLGYGDFSPLSWLKLLSSFEALSGLVNMGFLIAGYSNNKY